MFFLGNQEVQLRIVNCSVHAFFVVVMCIDALFVTSPGVLDNSTQRQPHLVAKVIANTRRGSGGPTKFPPPQGAIKMELYQVLILIVKLN